MGCVLSLLRKLAANPFEQKSPRHGAITYNGLINQGSTCYLNTVLQCLCMTKDFRTAVENFQPGQNDSHQGRTDLLIQLQQLFETLKETQGTTQGIIKSLGIKSVYKQQDAVEYYQKIVKAVGPPASQVFEGKMSNKSECVQSHIFQESCSFITIPLAIECGDDELYKVVEGFEAFFKHSKLDEDNWLYCDECDQKAESETWTEIEEIPTVLTLHLKRFYFDYTQMKHVKNHCSADIPSTLQVKDYKYDLYAVINHIGNQSGGHYNAVIKSFEDNLWYCFDDKSVMQTDGFPQSSQLPYLLMYKLQRAQGSWRSYALHKLKQPCVSLYYFCSFVRIFVGLFGIISICLYMPGILRSLRSRLCRLVRFL
uniref:Ubiquitin carboxyl-terminal hydrolase 47-like n=1 Tax=Astyanax mexicanus TaxID=7994 RepID=A0A3B1KD50_ASTMX